MIDGAHDLPITRQEEALNISGSSVYYLPRPVSEDDLAIMRRLDRLHLEFPFAGSRMLRGLLMAEGCKIGRRHVKTLMRRMGIEALYRCRRTTKLERGHKIYQYLLRGVEIAERNEVWVMDITYIPMARGFVYLAVVLDWFSRRVLAWRVSITMEAAFCVEALEDALARHGKPEIFNTDQGSQFTGAAFTGVLIKNEIAVSMDGGALGETTCSSSGCGAALNKRRCICGPTKASATPELRSAATWTFIMADVHMSLDGSHPIKPTSRRCPRLELTERSMKGKTVKTVYLLEAEKCFQRSLR